MTTVTFGGLPDKDIPGIEVCTPGTKLVLIAMPCWAAWAARGATFMTNSKRWLGVIYWSELLLNELLVYRVDGVDIDNSSAQATSRMTAYVRAASSILPQILSATNAACNSNSNATYWFGVSC